MITEDQANAASQALLQEGREKQAGAIEAARARSEVRMPMRWNLLGGLSGCVLLGAIGHFVAGNFFFLSTAGLFLGLAVARLAWRRSRRNVV